MLKAFGDFRKKKPATKQPQKPKKPVKTVRKPELGTSNAVPAVKPSAPKKVTSSAALVAKAAVLQDALPPNVHSPAHKVAFHRDGLFIDGIKYKVLAESGLSDEELTIGESRGEDGTTTLTLHAMGRMFTVTLRAADIDAMLGNLLKGRAYKTESKEGIVIRIERQLY